MLKIHQGYASDSADQSTMHTVIEFDGTKRELKISVDREYGKFLSPERSDYAVIGLLRYALERKHDIVCEAPISDDLLYNIQEVLIPTLVRTDPRNHFVKIQANIAPPLDKLPFRNLAGGGGLEQEFLAA